MRFKLSELHAFSHQAHGQDAQDLSNFKQPIVSAFCWSSFIVQYFILKNSEFHCLMWNCPFVDHYKHV